MNAVTGTRVVIRPVAERGVVYRIEHVTGEKTGTGLFVSQAHAEAYAREQGWLIEDAPRGSAVAALGEADTA